MGLIEGLIELIAPTRCAGCELPGTVFCSTCIAAVRLYDRSGACPACGAPFGLLVCTECWNVSFAFSRALALGELSGPLARAVVLHKDAGERRLGAVFGEMLGVEVARRWAGWADAVCWVPATQKALIRRGFDHAEGIAGPIARTLDVELSALLSRREVSDQRTLGRDARIVNAKDSFAALGVSPSRVVLVDDVMTTGSTLDAAASVLLSSGCSEVRVAVVARAW